MKLILASIKMTASIKTVLCSLFITCIVFAQQGDFQIDKEQKVVVIEKVLELIKANYVFPEKFDQLERDINNKLNKYEYDNLNNPQEFLNQLNQDLQTAAQDRHLKISYSPQIVEQIIEDSKKEENEPTDYTPELLSWIKFENYGMRKVERMDGNIGYLKFDRFTDLQLAKKIITGAMNFIGNSSAIILDLRDNGGGDADASEFFINYFFPDGKKLGDVKFRKDELSKEIIINHDPSVTEISNEVPVYILVSKQTASAAEAVTYFLQQFKRSIVVGETTGGKANPGELFAVNDFLYIMIPTGYVTVLPTGTNWEGSGVIPDIKIDPLFALPQAMVEICSVLEKQDQDKEHKTLYRWISEQYKAQLNQQFPSEQFINNIIGNYENNRKIIFENGIVYYIGSTGFKRRLAYLGNQTFMIEGRNDYRLRFQDNNKTSDYYEVLWYDGTSEIVNRSR